MRKLTSIESGGLMIGITFALLQVSVSTYAAVDLFYSLVGPEGE